MKIKTITTAALLMSSILGSSAFAAGKNEVTFVGTVLAAACSGEVTNDSTGNSITVGLGEVTPSGTGTETIFTVAFKTAAGEACGTGSDNASLSFVGEWGAEGLSNTNGTATGAQVLLKDGATAITKAAPSVTKTLTQWASGVPFKAQLKSGTTAGTVKTTVVYALSVS